MFKKHEKEKKWGGGGEEGKRSGRVREKGKQANIGKIG